MKNSKKSAFTLIELLVVLVILFIFGAMIVGGCAKVMSTSEGQRIGTLTKFSYKGFINKSYEGELLMGGMRTHRDSDGHLQSVANIWCFSVSDPNIAKQLENHLGQQIVLKYKQSAVVFARDTTYDVISFSTNTTTR